MKPPGRWLVVCLLTALPLAAQTSIDSTQGVVDGKAAISFWPSDGFETASCTAHLVSAGDLDGEMVVPCGEWILPSAGKYKYWLEKPGRVSASSAVFSFAVETFGGRGGVLESALSPAGKVALPPAGELKAGTVLRLLHLDSHLRDVRAGREFSRRVSSQAAARAGVLMPEGDIVVALHDGASREYLAVSRPLDVDGGKVVWLDLRPPAEGTDLVVKLERPTFVTDPAEFKDLPTVAVDGGEPLSPNVLVPAPDRIYAVWYGLSGDYANLEVSSPSVYVEPQDIPLRPRRVESFNGFLVPLPDLDVALDLPPEIEVEALWITVSTETEAAPLRRIELTAGDRSARIEALPAEPLRVTLEVPPWELEEKVDLSDGLDHQITLRSQPIRVSGTVYFGDDEHPAIVTFQTTDRKENTGFLTVETDVEGFYRTLLLRPWLYNVAVQIDGPGGARFTDIQAIRDDMTLDFHLPANRYRVVVVDEDTRDAIPDAKVGYMTYWQRDDGSARSSGTYVMADKEGVARLPPIRPGRLEVDVSNDGYFPSGIRVQPVGEGEGDRRLTVVLRPVGETADLRLVLPTGAPARQAAVAIVPDLEGSPGSWWATADGDGRVEVPERLQGQLLVVLHPQAGFLVRRWQVPGSTPARWPLPDAAPPLALRTLSPAGEPAAAMLGLVIDGHRIAGSILRQLTGSASNASDADGRWAARNLPAGTVQVVAWSDPGSEARFRSGFLDSLAVTVGYPWPESVEIPIAD